MSGGEEPREVLGVLRQVLRDRRELGDLLKTYQMERQRRESEVRMVEGRLEGVERAKGHIYETLHAAEDRVKFLEGEVERARREGGEGVREQKGKNAQLLAKLKQSEHRVRQREAHIDNMNSKLEAMVRGRGGRKGGREGWGGSVRGETAKTISVSERESPLFFLFFIFNFSALPPFPPCLANNHRWHAKPRKKKTRKPSFVVYSNASLVLAMES